MQSVTGNSEETQVFKTQNENDPKHITIKKDKEGEIIDKMSLSFGHSCMLLKHASRFTGSS